MNGLNLILLLIIGVLVTDAHGNQCEPIVKSPEVNFTRIFAAAQWYGTYTMTKESVYANNAPPDIDCIIMTGGRVLTDKIETDVQSNNNGSSIAAHGEISQNRTGIYYIYRKSVVEELNDELILEGSGKRIQKKDLAMGGKRTLILTDYVIYYGYATCSSEGNWVIWIGTPKPLATAKQLNLARNKLAEHRICAQLLPSNCGELDLKGLLK